MSKEDKGAEPFNPIKNIDNITPTTAQSDVSIVGDEQISVSLDGLVASLGLQLDPKSLDSIRSAVMAYTEQLSGTLKSTLGSIGVSAPDASKIVSNLGKGSTTINPMGLYRQIDQNLANNYNPQLDAYVSSLKTGSGRNTHTYTYDVESASIPTKDGKMGPDKVVAFASSNTKTGKQELIVDAGYETALQDAYNSTGKEIYKSVLNNLTQEIKNFGSKVKKLEGPDFAKAIFKDMYDAASTGGIQFQAWNASSDNTKLRSLFADINQSHNAEQLLAPLTFNKNGTTSGRVVSLDTSYKKLFDFRKGGPDDRYEAGWRQTQAADLMGLLRPEEAGKAHGPVFDVTLLERIGKVLNQSSYYERNKMAGADIKMPQGVKMLTDHLGQNPQKISSWQDRVFLRRVAEDFDSLYSIKIKDENYGGIYSSDAGDRIPAANAFRDRGNLQRNLDVHRRTRRPGDKVPIIKPLSEDLLTVSGAVKPKGSRSAKEELELLIATQAEGTAIDDLDTAQILSGRGPGSTTNSDWGIEDDNRGVNANKVNDTNHGNVGINSLYQDTTEYVPLGSPATFVSRLASLNTDPEHRAALGAPIVKSSTLKIAPLTLKDGPPISMRPLAENLEKIQLLHRTRFMEYLGDKVNEVKNVTGQNYLHRTDFDQAVKAFFSTNDAAEGEIVKSLISGIVGPDGRQISGMNDLVKNAFRKTTTVWDEGAVPLNWSENKPGEKHSQRVSYSKANQDLIAQQFDIVYSQAVGGHLMGENPHLGNANITSDYFPITNKKLLSIPTSEYEFNSKYGFYDRWGAKPVAKQLMKMYDARNNPEEYKKLEDELNAASVKPHADQPPIGFKREPFTSDDQAIKSDKSIKRGTAYEKQSLLKDLEAQGFIIINKQKNNETGEWELKEIGGRIGDVTGHPDVLAIRPEKVNGEWKNIPYLIEGKSPDKSLGKHATMNTLMDDKYKRYWIAQLMAYAEFLPKQWQDSLRIGVAHQINPEKATYDSDGEITFTEMPKTGITFASYKEFAQRPEFQFQSAQLAKRNEKISKRGLFTDTGAIAPEIGIIDTALGQDFTQDEQARLNAEYAIRNKAALDLLSKTLQPAVGNMQNQNRAAVIKRPSIAVFGDSKRPIFEEAYNNETIRNSLYGGMSKEEAIGSMLSMVDTADVEYNKQMDMHRERVAGEQARYNDAIEKWEAREPKKKSFASDKKFKEKYDAWKADAPKAEFFMRGMPSIEDIKLRAIQKATRNPDVEIAGSIGKLVIQQESASAAAAASSVAKISKSDSLFNKFNETRDALNNSFFRGRFTDHPGFMGPIGPENKPDWFSGQPIELQGFEDAAFKRDIIKSYEAKAKQARLQAQHMVSKGEARSVYEDSKMSDIAIVNFASPTGKGEGYKDIKNQYVGTAAFYTDAANALKEHTTVWDNLLTIHEKETKAYIKKLEDDVMYARQLRTNISSPKLSVPQQIVAAVRHDQFIVENFSPEERTKFGLEPLVAKKYNSNPYAAFGNGDLNAFHPAQIAQNNLIRDELLRQEKSSSAQYTSEQGIMVELYAPGGDASIKDYLTTQRKRLSDKVKYSEILETHVSSLSMDEKERDKKLKEIKSNRRSAELSVGAIDQYLKIYDNEEESAQFHTPESALRSVEGSRKDSLIKHINNAMLAQSEAINFGLTPELFKSVVSSSLAISKLGVNPLDKGINLLSLVNRNMPSFEASDSLNKVGYLINTSGKDNFTGKAKVIGAQQSYADSLKLDLQNVIAGESSFVKLGRAIETDIALISSLKEKLSTLKPGTDEYDAIKKQLKFREEKAAKRQSVMDQQLDNTVEELDPRNYVYHEKSQAENTKASKIKKYTKQNTVITAAEEIRRSLDEGDVSADTIDSAMKMLKQFEKHGLSTTSPNLPLNKQIVRGAVLAHSESADEIKKAMANIEPSASMTQFKSATQVLNNFSSNSSNSGNINVFETIHQKEQQALKTLKELKNTFAETGEINLDSTEGKIEQLNQKILVATANLHKLKTTGASTEEINQQNNGISSMLGQYESLIKQSAAEDRKKFLNPQMWDAQQGLIYKKDSNGNESGSYMEEEAALKLKAIEANRRIADLGSKGSYEDFTRARDIAKELRQRGIDTTGHPGLWTEKQVEQHALKSGKTFFEGQQHVNFTEQLVDLANWQVQWAGATAVTKGFTTALFGGFGAAKEFEASMRDVELISQATSVQIEGLKEKVLDLGSNFKVPVKELADGLIILGQAGYKASDSIQMIQPISQLAVATGSSHKQASDITTSVMMAYDQPSNATADVTNTLAATAITSKLELGSLGTTFNYIGSTAAMAGLSLEETATAMGLMSKAGVKASTIGTSLRSIIGALIAPTANFKAELGRVGISIDELNPRTNSLGNVLSKLNAHGFNVENAFEGMSKREAGAMTALLNQSDKWGSFQGSITGTDRAEAMATGQMDTYDAQVKRLSNNAQVTGVKVFQGSLEPLKTSAKVLSWGLEGIGSIADTSFGKATASIVSTTMAAMTATTVLGTLGKALWITIPAATVGAKKAWGFDVGSKLPDEPRRGRIYEGVQSLAGIGFNPWAIGAAALLAGGMFAAEKIGSSDYLWGNGQAGLKRETLKYDYFANLQEKIDTAAKQQPDIDLFDKGNTSERKAYISALSTSGLFTSTDEKGRLIDPELVRQHKSLSPKNLNVDSQLLDLQEFSAGLRSYNDSVVTPRLLTRLSKTANRTVRDQDKLYTEEGKSAVQLTADKYIEVLKQKGIFYDKEKSAQFLNSYMPGSVADDAIIAFIKEKQEIAMKAPDRADIEKSANKEYFKRAASDAFGVQEVLRNKTSKVSQNRIMAAEKAFITDELKNEAVEDTLKRRKPYRDMIESKRAEYEKASPMERADKQNELLNLLESLRVVQGLESFEGIKERASKSYEEQFSPASLKKHNETMIEAYTRVITSSPELAKDKGEYSTAGKMFNEKATKDATEYGGVLRSLKVAQDELKAAESKGTESNEYKIKELHVRALQMRLEELGVTMQQLHRDSFKFHMPDVDHKLIPTVLDLAYPSKFANTRLNSAMKFIPTIDITEFRSRSEALEKKYQPLKNEAMVVGDQRALARIDLAWKFSVEDMQDELIASATAKVKEAGDKLEAIIGKEFQNKTTAVQLKVDVSTLDIDIKGANNKKDAILSERDVIKGTQEMAAIDYTEYGFPSWKPRYNTTAWAKHAPLLDTSNFSADVSYTSGVRAEMDKLKVSKDSSSEIAAAALAAASEARLQGIKTAYATTAPGLRYDLPKTPAEMVHTSTDTPEATKLKLIDVEEKYQQARISASSKALQAIRKDIESELKLRDQLLEKIKSLDDSKQGFKKEVDASNKELRKAAGIDTRNEPEKILKDMDSLIAQGYKYAKEGKVDKVQEVKVAVLEKSKELATEEYGSYWRLEATKRNDKLVPMYDTAVNNRRAEYSNLVEEISNNTTNNRQAMDAWAASIRDSIKSSSGISNEEKSIRIKNFDERLAAAGSSPEKMSEVIRAEAKHPEIATVISGEEAFKDFVNTIPALNNAFKDLLPVLREIAGLTGKGQIGQDVTPTKASLKELIGETAFKTLGLDAVPEDKLPTITRRVSIPSVNGKHVNGVMSEDGSNLQYTDEQSLKHELRHVVQKAIGMQFSGNSEYDRKLAAEYDADNAAGVSDTIMLQRYNLPRGLDATNLNSAQLDSLRRSKAATQTYNGVYSLGDDDPNDGTPMARFISRTAHAALPPLIAAGAGTLAGLAATPETLGVGTIPAVATASALGWGGGKQLARAVDSMMGYGRHFTIPQQIAVNTMDIAEGFGVEMGDQILIKGAEVAYPYVKAGARLMYNRVRPMVKTHDGNIARPWFGIRENFSKQKLYHGDAAGKLARDPASFNTETEEAFFMSPSRDFSSVFSDRTIKGVQNGGLMEGGLAKGTKVFDFRTASKDDWSGIQDSIRKLLRTHTRTGRPIKPEWKNDLSVPSKPLINIAEGLPVEPGYAYRTVSEQEVRSLAEEGVLTPKAKYDNVAPGIVGKGHEQTTRKTWSQFDREGTPYSPQNIVLRVPIEKLPTKAGKLVRAEDVQVMRYDAETKSWNAAPAAKEDTTSFIKHTVEAMKIGKWNKIESGLGRKAIERQGYDAATMTEAIAASTKSGVIEFGDPALTLAVFNKKKVTGLKTIKQNWNDPIFTGNNELPLTMGDIPAATVDTAVKETVAPSKWAKIKSLSPSAKFEKLSLKEQKAVVQKSVTSAAILSAYMGIPPIMSSIIKGTKPELTPAQQLAETETRGMNNARTNWAAYDYKVKASTEQNEQATQAKNLKNIVMNPSAMADKTYDEMYSKMAFQQRPFDILEGTDKKYKGKSGLKKYYIDSGLSSKEASAKVKETVEKTGQYDEDQIKSSAKDIRQVLPATQGIIDNISNEEQTSPAVDAEVARLTARKNQLINSVTQEQVGDVDIAKANTPEDIKALAIANVAKRQAYSPDVTFSLGSVKPDRFSSDPAKLLGIVLPGNKEVTDEDVTPATSAIDQVKEAVKAPISSIAADKNPYSMVADFNPYSAMSADVPSKAKALYSVTDTAPQGALKDLTVQTNTAPSDVSLSQSASNDKLIVALDSLRSVIEKASNTSTPGATPGATPGVASATNVTVNAPVTVSTNYNGGGGSQVDVSAVVTKICNDFFTTEFNRKFAEAVNTVSV